MPKKFTRFVPRVRSSQGPRGSHFQLMAGITLPFRSVVRFGSKAVYRDMHRRVEVNTTQAIRNSSNKLVMKGLFAEGAIKSPRFFPARGAGANLPSGWKFPVVAKLSFRSGGKGMMKLDTQEQYADFLRTKGQRTENPYYIEEYVNCKREYRIHVSAHNPTELFSVRKLVSEDVPKEKQWIKSIANGAFVEEFDKPSQWPAMVSECKKALTKIGLDIGCFDVKYKKTDGSFYILEVNSSPAMGPKTKEIYRKELKNVLMVKHNQTLNRR